ncbi:hypothetical protein D3C76_915630 [compost metagenome]
MTLALAAGAPLLSFTRIVTRLAEVPSAGLLFRGTTMESITLFAVFEEKCPCLDALLSPELTVNVKEPATADVKSVFTMPLTSVTD